MLRILAVVTVLLLALTVGCSWGPWQANSGSEAVTINPFAWGSGQVVSPADGPGYMNGEPMVMRK